MTDQPERREGDPPSQGRVPPPPYDTLAALAAQVGDIRGKVRFLESIVDRAGLAFVSDLKARQGRLTADLDALATQVENLAVRLEGALAAGPRTAAPTWVGLTDEQRDAQLGALSQWVETLLVPSYSPDPPIMACWHNHWAAIWELSTIWAEWRRIYQRPAPDLQGALDFHNRWLPSALERTGRALAKCTDRQCAASASRHL